jgi:hypothetical protein
MRTPMIRPQLAAIALVASIGTISSAQTQRRVVVRVVATDSTGAPVTSAELTVIRGIRDVLARGSTDSLGHATLIIPGVKDTTDLQVVMRKIGYARSDRFFAAAPQDTVFVGLMVPRPLNTLAPVKVTAQADVKAKSYHLDADDIAKSNIPFVDAWDVVKRLRPDILTSRGGCSTGVQEVWVNGEHIRLPLPPIGMAAARARVGAPPRARFSYVPVSVLSEIAPEHIEEMTYRDCFDHSMAVVGSVNALFVVLKPGVTYVQDVGSFVLETTSDKPPRE